ncbi:MAG: toll/interleukin-1 receptor domain-containing protein [Cellvibrionaceae bacterium]|nr:toll/interleukin-1 receptor domain-containing protein [Cellvibrionaceae bacterium]
MGNSVLAFISHASEDKEDYIEPISDDLESCYINIWIDKRKIVPGDNLRKSILQDGLDKADIVLIFFTEKSLKSSWVDTEIKHVLREKHNKDSDFDLNKIISIFDSTETYESIRERYPELTDDLLHLMPVEYGKIELGQLISAIWSKYFSLQGGDIETQRQLLQKDKEGFEKDKKIQALELKLEKSKKSDPKAAQSQEFEDIYRSGKLNGFLAYQNEILNSQYVMREEIKDVPEAMAFGLVQNRSQNTITITEKGKEFFRWVILNEDQ